MSKRKIMYLAGFAISCMCFVGCKGEASESKDRMSDATTETEKQVPVSTEQEDSLTTEQENWIYDLDGQFREQLAKTPGVSEYLSDDAREAEIDQLISDIKEESLDSDEIFYRVRELISDVHIAHVSFQRPMDYDWEQDNQAYLVCGQWFEDGFYITATQKENEECLGSKLVGINGLSLDEVVSRYDRIVSNETQSWLKDAFEWKSKNGFSRKEFLYLKIAEPESDTVTFSFEKDGKTFSKEIGITQVNEETPVVSLVDNSEKLPLGERMYETGEPFLYQLDLENRTLYFQYNRCLDPTVGEEYASYPVFADFMDDMMAELEKNRTQIDRIVIDLRHNEGGSEMLWNDAVDKYCDELNQYEIDLLIGRTTFSAGVDAIDTSLYCLDHVVLYGEETGLAVHNYTDVKPVTLKRTGYILQTVTHEDYNNVINKRAKDVSRGVLPDVEVEQTFEDYLKGIDDVYESAVAGSID